jgi:hypothetical protein
MPHQYPIRISIGSDNAIPPTGSGYDLTMHTFSNVYANPLSDLVVNARVSILCYHLVHYLLMNKV